MNLKKAIVTTMLALGLTSVSAEAVVSRPTAAVDTLGRVVDLQEIVVKPTKEKYSKRNNKAVDFVDAIRRTREMNDPYRRDNYNYNKYERITIALNNVEDSFFGRGGLTKKFGFLNQYVDTSDVTGKRVLPITVKEKVSEVNYRRQPEARKERIIGMKQQGLDEFANQDNIQTFLEEIFREINLYDNDITILSNKFVSPLSKIGSDFYKYYLTDTVSVEGERCAVLSFVPHNNATFGFLGRIFVPINDSTMFIKKVTMTLSPQANVNFIKSLNISQSYKRADSGERLLDSDCMTVEFAIIPGTDGLYAQRLSHYSNHNFEPAPNPEIFNRLGDTFLTADAYLKDDDFWNFYRRGRMMKAEAAIGEIVNSMRNIPLYYWFEKALKILVTGYVETGEKSKVDIGPVNTMISYNDVEGTRFRLGGITTANLSKHLFARGFVAYGLKDKKLKYSGELEYSFNEKKRHSREFPIHSIKLSHSYDVDALGQQYAFTNPDNVFLSLKRMDDTLMVYQRKTAVDYTLELNNHFSVALSLSHVRQEQSPFVKFQWSDGHIASHISFTTASLTLRYAPGEKFYQTKSARFPINLDNPVIMLKHTYGPAGFIGSNYVVNKTEIDLQKRFWLSAFGYLDVILKGGHVWSTVPYTQLLIPNANLSYTIQPESFALLNPMEFITDTYASLDFTYWANGAILNYVPLIKKLKWREVFAFRGVWGDLSDKNNPVKNSWLPQFPTGANTVGLNHTLYMEASVGLDNVLKCLRLDYVWRLSYRNSPNVDKSGLRVSLHFTF
jgi:hypothetical protein